MYWFKFLSLDIIFNWIRLLACSFFFLHWTFNHRVPQIHFKWKSFSNSINHYHGSPFTIGSLSLSWFTIHHWFIGSFVWFTFSPEKFANRSTGGGHQIHRIALVMITSLKEKNWSHAKFYMLDLGLFNFNKFLVISRFL